ncbi:MAG: DUF2141 domain-containing protein, partial [Pseudomonadota bacterium]
ATGFPLLAYGETDTRTLDIEVTGVAPGEAQIMVGVCSEEKFLKPDCEVSEIVPAGDSWKQMIRISAPATGTFAVQIAYDIDSSNVLETNRFGAPREPVGFSNNPKARFGPPRFTDAALDFATVAAPVIIHLE